jgi:hypothetical protein
MPRRSIASVLRSSASDGFRLLPLVVALTFGLAAELRFDFCFGFGVGAGFGFDADPGLGFGLLIVLYFGWLL